MPGELLGVRAEFLDGGSLPVIRAQHRAYVVQARGRLPTAVEERARRRGAHANAQRIRLHQPCGDQRTHERVAGASAALVWSRAVHDAVDEECAGALLPAWTPAYADLPPDPLESENPPGVELELLSLPKPIELTSGLGWQQMTMDIPIGQRMSQEPPALAKRQAQPELGRMSPYSGDDFAPVASALLSLVRHLAHECEEPTH